MLKPEMRRWMRVQDAAKYASLSVHFVKGLLRKRRLDLDAYLKKLAQQREQPRHNASSANVDGHGEDAEDRVDG
jgi:hypothetical protein